MLSEEMIKQLEDVLNKLNGLVKKLHCSEREKPDYLKWAESLANKFPKPTEQVQVAMPDCDELPHHTGCEFNPSNFNVAGNKDSTEDDVIKWIRNFRFSCSDGMKAANLGDIEKAAKSMAQVATPLNRGDSAMYDKRFCEHHNNSSDSALNVTHECKNAWCVVLNSKLFDAWNDARYDDFRKTENRLAKKVNKLIHKLKSFRRESLLLNYKVDYCQREIENKDKQIELLRAQLKQREDDICAQTKNLESLQSNYHKAVKRIIELQGEMGRAGLKIPPYDEIGKPKKDCVHCNGTGRILRFSWFNPGGGSEVINCDCHKI